MWTLPTYDWPQQRERCLSCAHCKQQVDAYSAATVLLCTASAGRGRRGIYTCIDNRTSGKCGAHAKLWKEKNT